MQKTRTVRRSCAFHLWKISSTSALQPATPNEVRPARFMSLTSARLLASSRSGATFGSRAATGRVAAMSPLMTPVGFPAASRMIEPLTKSGGSGAFGFDPERLQRPAVQKDLIVGLLQRHRIVRRDLRPAPRA